MKPNGGLEFKGLQKTTLVDYPGEVACTLFLPGCNFRCGYCYNPDLVLNRETGVRIVEDEALEFLKTRRGFLDGVCVTGGEPLLHWPQLREFLRRTKTLGYKVKLDTNGSFPGPLRGIIEARLVDYLAMDIKAPREKYAQVVKSRVVLADIEESVQLIRGSGVDYEFRTTVFSDLSLEDFDQIGRWLSGSRKYCLQPVRVDLPLLDETFANTHQPPALAYLHQIAALLRPHFDEIEVRA